MKTTFDKAERVSRTIGRRIGYPDWYLGVAIEHNTRDGFTLSVRIERGHPLVALPPRIDGVKVRVVHDTMARPLPKPRRTASS